MRLTGSRVYSRPPPVPKMPPGLVELMEGLTKDVLKNNPPEVYEFCAEHMRKLLEIRDGPSTNKPLSLEQKISRAQEKVRKRAEQRRRKFDDDLQQENKLEKDNQVPDGKNSAVDENILPTIIKPVHHNDLTQDSEIEISCEPSGTELRHGESGAKHILETALEGENIDLKESNQTAAKEDDKCNDVKDQEKDVPVSEDTNIDQPQKENCDTKYATLDTTPKEFDTAEKVQSGDENIEIVKGDLSHISDHVTEGSADNIEKDSTTDVKVQGTVGKSEVSRVPTVHDTIVAVEENDNGNQTSSVNLPESEKNDGSVLTNTTTDFENQDGTSTVGIVRNDSKSHMQSGMADVSDKDNIIEATETKEKVISEEKEENNKVPQGVLTDHDTTVVISKINSTNDTEESTTDLEKVMNEAIENSKRKDSSAEDSLKENLVFNDESDASEGTNVVLNKITLNEPMKENDANILFDKDYASHSNETGNNATISENQDSVDIERPRPKRSLDDSNKEQSNVNQEDTEITAEILNSSTSLPDDSLQNVDDKTPKNDNSNTMDLETAAVTIQKVFRNFLFKSRASTFDESVNEENNLSDDDDKKEDDFLPANNLNKERRTLGLSRMDTVLQTVNEEKSLSLSTDDSSLSSAATIIQAHVRGFLLRNKLNSLKSASKNSLGISNGPSSKSLDADVDQNKSKTVLNIHIVPEGGNYLSRDESMITSMDLSLDGSPPSSVNLHPLGYNTSERRKQLKREDAVQSVSPPSNNSGKLSEDVDSVKELPINEHDSNANQEQKTTGVSMFKDDSQQDTELGSLETTTNSLTVETVVDQNTSNTEMMSSPEPNTDTSDKTKKSLIKQSSDEMDVVTPFKENSSTEDTKLLHSGEFHDTVLPTKVSRSDTPVVSEFKNVLVYFLLWNNS
ncbi:hypothetical protein ABMA27_007412 [Loxostege sticticalis]|uniref:RIIa domain-containing protein n=1 Tax=Loxostege sticticalis TaxID=481309 RepID=A0ABR3HFE1_LOXSC